MNEEILDILYSLDGFGNLSCYLNPDVSNYDKVTEKDIIQKLVTEAIELGIQHALTDIHAVLNMDPFPYREIVSFTERLIYDEKKKEWVDDDPDLCRKWLENIYKMIEEEAIKQGKLNPNYQEEKWFLIYKTPPEHLKNFLMSISSELAECDTEAMEEIVLEKFVEDCTQSGETQRILIEGHEVLTMDPFPCEWVQLVLYSSTHNKKKQKFRELYSHLYPKFFGRILDTLEHEAMKQENYN